MVLLEIEQGPITGSETISEGFNPHFSNFLNECNQTPYFVGINPALYIRLKENLCYQ